MELTGAQKINGWPWSGRSSFEPSKAMFGEAMRSTAPKGNTGNGGWMACLPLHQ